MTFFPLKTVIIHEKKTVDLYYIKIKSVYPAKDDVKRMRKQAINLEKIFAKHRFVI